MTATRPSATVARVVIGPTQPSSLQNTALAVTSGAADTARNSTHAALSSAGTCPCSSAFFFPSTASPTVTFVGNAVL